MDLLIICAIILFMFVFGVFVGAISAELIRKILAMKRGGCKPSPIIYKETADQKPDVFMEETRQ